MSCVTPCGNVPGLREWTIVQISRVESTRRVEVALRGMPKLTLSRRNTWTRHGPVASRTLCGNAAMPPAGAGGWLDTAASPPMTAK